MPAEAQILFYSDLPDEGGLIEQTLRQVSGSEHVRVASDPKAALDLLANEKFDLVFARSQKGALASTDFLNEVWKANPKSTRFVLADSAPDSEALVRCALGAHQLISTPVDPDGLSAALERANSIKRFVKSERIQLLVSRMRTLPSRPTLYVELMRELRSSNASAGTVGELVSKDLAISAKLIQVANSAFMGLEQQVSEPASAVLQLGLETTASLVLSIEAFARFDKVKPIYFSIDRVWKHSQSVADLARKICQLTGCDPEVSGQAYTAGLLHDIGKLAFAQNFEEDYQRTLKEAEAKALPVYEVEQLVFGGTHADTGAYLLAVWGLPLPIVEAVADHHLPTSQLSGSLSASVILHLAEQLSGSPERADEIVAEYPPELGLAPYADQLRALLDGGTSKPSQPHKVSAVSPNQPKPNPAPRRQKVVRKEDRGGQFKLNQPIVLLALAASVIILVLGGFLFFRKSPPPEAAAPRLKKSEVSATASKAEEKAPVKPPAVASKPVEPETPSPSANLKLQAIMYNGDKSGLIINGVLLHPGDSIEGWRVSSVTAKQAVLEHQGQRQILSLQ
jgi:putative nucleotidyltransferase with HDIG domain